MKSSLQFNDEGLDVRSESGPDQRVFWNSVLEVFVFKDDAWAYDIICLGFRLDEEGTYFKIDEEHSGYKELVSFLPIVFPGIRDDWFSYVALPAFEPCLTTIWGEPKNSKYMEPISRTMRSTECPPASCQMLSRYAPGICYATGRHR